ncbi:MAG: single-stranded DNA-binding protein [Candidatus Cryptobacteroides sp.]
MSLNKVMLIGNVGRDPEVRYLDGGPQGGNGTKVATFTLATTERYRDRNGETRENTEWHNIVAWRNSADLAEKYIRKGSQVFIEGKLRTRSWNDQAGQKRYTTEITVDNIQLLGRKSDNPLGEGAPAAAPAAVRPVQPQAPAGGNFQAANSYTAAPAEIRTDEKPEDDLPF